MVFTAVVHVPVRVRVTLAFKVSRILTITHHKALILRLLIPCRVSFHFSFHGFEPLGPVPRGGAVGLSFIAWH